MRPPVPGTVAVGHLKDDDELISAKLVSDDDDLMLISRKGMSARFKADDSTLRPMGRSTSGVIGMRFRDGDSLLAMDVVVEGADLVTVTDGGFAKRTSVDQWATKGRGIMGVRAMKLVEERGALVGALICQPGDEIFAVASDGVVIRTRVDEVRVTGRDTMGVSMMRLTGERSLVAVARAAELDDEPDESEDTAADSPENVAPESAEGNDGAEQSEPVEPSAAVDSSVEESGKEEN